MFPLVSLLILLIAGIMCFIGQCHATRKVLTFVSGILFVLAGKSCRSSFTLLRCLTYSLFRQVRFIGACSSHQCA